MIREESREKGEGGEEESESKDSEEDEEEAGGDGEGEEDLEEEDDPQIAGEESLLLALKVRSLTPLGSEEGMEGRGKGEERKKRTSSKKEARADLQNG